MSISFCLTVNLVDSFLTAYLNQNNSKMLRYMAYLFVLLGALFSVQHYFHTWNVLSVVHYRWYMFLYYFLIVVSLFYILMSFTVLNSSKSPLFDRYINLFYVSMYLAVVIGLNILDLHYSLELVPLMMGLIFLVVLYRESPIVQILIIVLPLASVLTAIHLIVPDQKNVWMLTFYLSVFGFVAFFASHMLYRSFIERFIIMSELNDRNCQLDTLNTRLRSYKVSMERDLRIAERIQQEYLQNRPGIPNGWDFDVRFVPKNGVSGDFYDIYCSGSELYGVSLFDVTGHGVASSLVTMLAKRIFYRLFAAYRDTPLSQLAALFNLELLEEIGNSHIYIAGVVLKYDGKGFEYINAGHTDILIKKADGSVRPVLDSHDERNPFFCLSEFTEGYGVKYFELQPGDTIIMATDGIYELQPAKGASVISYKGIENFIADLPAKKSAGYYSEKIVSYVSETSGRSDFDDDMTLVVLCRKDKLVIGE